MALTMLQRNALQTRLTNGDIDGFYADLEDFGDPFGRLGLAVTTNEGWQGQLANGFARNGAQDDSVDMSVGSPDWTAVNTAIAERYFLDIEANNGGLPTRSQIQTAHNEVYDNANLDPDDWFVNKLLNDSGNPDALWNDFMANQGTGDLWDDAGAVLASGADLLFGPYMLYKALFDANGIDPTELEFAKNFLNALAEMDEAELQEMLGDFSGNGPMTALLEAVLGLPHIPNDPSNGFPSNDSLPTGSQPTGSYVPGTTVPFGQGENAVSPIVLDVDGSGTIELVALNASGSVYWDIDQDGFSEASGWITGGDGLLCIDLNSDGIINDHGELFGGTNGYVTLDAYDTNNNNTITSADTDFGDLRVWVDTNADGFSQTGELHTLSSLGITSIATSYSNVNYTIAGNQISYQSTFVMNGNTYTSVDAFFTYDNVNTKFAGDYTVDLRTLFLPTVRGYGELPDLHVAMSMDEDLLDLVQEFSEQTPAQLIAASFTTNSDIQDIMFKWAGVDGVSPTSRGAYIDARILGFLEAFVGHDFNQYGNSNPLGWNASNPLMEAWNNAYEAIAARLIYQASGAGQLFVGDASYDPVSDSFNVPTGVNFDAVESWISAATWTDQISEARYVVKAIDEILGISGLSSPDYASLEALLPDYTTVAAFMHTVVGTTSTINGTSDDNLILGTSSADTINGNAGKDVILADAGNDSINGGDGNDTLVGGAGGDAISGSTGNDTYVFASGFGADYVYENSGEGSDAFRMMGYADTDVRLLATSGGYLQITSKANSSDYVTYYVGTTGASGTTNELAVPNVEQIVFDNTTVSLTSGLSLEGTSSSDNLYGTQYNDYISALGGADSLYGNRGNDTLTGGAGSDNLFGGTGDDAYVFASGFGADYVYENSGEGTDTLQFNGYADTDVRFSTTGGGYLQLTSKASSSDYVTYYVGTTGASGTTNELAVPNVEQASFSNTTLSLTGGLSLEGTSSSENLYGTQYGDQIKGMDDSDQLYGNRGADTIYGGNGSDNLFGGDGNDVLYGGSGLDYILGEAGGDTFVFENASAFSNQDTIADFSVANGDKLDIHDIIDTAFDPVTNLISQFVDFTNSGGNSIMSIDRDGAGTTYGFANVAMISGVTNLDETTLYANGNLLAA